MYLRLSVALVSMVFLLGKLSGQRGISWDTATLKRISAPDSAAFYPRMIQLNNADLLASYATNGNVVVAISNDNGKYWSKPIMVAPQRDKVNMDTPDLLQLKNGDILLCFGSRPQAALRGKPDSSKAFEIRVVRSTDNGLTWLNEQVLYKAGNSFKNGCWEPSMLQLPDGDIQLFFANEALYTSSDEQNISMLQSSDNGQSWSTEPKIISFRKASRDGMPVPIWNKFDQKIAIAIEDPGLGNFKPYTIESGTGGYWNNVVTGKDKHRHYALAVPISDSIYAGAPYLRQLSDGTTILSYQSTENRMVNKDHNSIMQVAVGDRHARNFSQVPLPFSVPEGLHAMWNALCILRDDTIIAITSTNAYSGRRSEVWMIKGRLK